MKTYFSVHCCLWSLIFLGTFQFSGYAQESDFDKIIWAVDWSPDGKFVAVGGNNGDLKVYTKKKFDLFKTYPIKGTITALKWHPSQPLLAIAMQNSENKISLLNFESGKFIELENDIKGGARGLDWNFDGQYLAVADNEGIITIYTKEGKFLKSIKKENTKSYTALHWHPSKNIFLTVSTNIRMYTLEGTLLNKIQNRPEEVLMLCVQWHPSGEFFVTGDYGTYDGVKPLLQFWNYDGTLRKKIIRSKAEYRNIRWSKDGKKLASASDALRIWSKTGELIRETKSENLLWGLDWNPNGKCILTSSIKGKVKVWGKKAKLKQTLN